jgi:hypothetical protein
MLQAGRSRVRFPEVIGFLQSPNPSSRTIAQVPTQLLKPGIYCAWLPRETIFAALPRKVDTMLPRAAERTLPRANLARVEPNQSGSLSRGKGISVCCALSAETVVWRSGVSFAASIKGRTQLPLCDAGHEHGY